MVFDDFGALVRHINTSLSGFGERFGTERKRLASLGKRPTRGILFTYDPSKARDWAINEGGGLEVQYHIGYNTEESTVYYGLGFNTQYVPFANQKSMVEYAKPFMNAFLLNEQEIRKMLPDYEFVIGSRESLITPGPDEYSLFGKVEEIGFEGGKMTIEDDVLRNLLENLERQFEAYELIFETKNTHPDMNAKLILITNLIRYKKQVILQGPPGTGKTRLAMQIAAELTRPSRISIEDIRKMVKPGLIVESIYDKIPYKVVTVGDSGITLQLENKSMQTRSYAYIIQAYSNLLINKPLEGGDTYQAAIAKYIKDNWKDEHQLKIIQFHPSYSYEDFVRGIVAETKGDKIEYRSVNKVLGKISSDARKNWEDSKKDIGDVLKENKVREYFEQFSDDLNESIMIGDKISLTPSVNIVDVEEDAFRYKGGDGWSNLGNRMLFKDVIQAYVDGNRSRQDIKKNNSLSGLAKQHATYYFNALNLFVKYLQEKKLGFDNIAAEKTEARNFVLVIDEINRANLSAVLGEMIYALEYRAHGVESVYEVDGSNELILPPNLYIIGTMNTADRSVGHIDYAIRRRFAFSYIMPEDLSNEPGIKFHKVLFDTVSSFFDRYLSPEFEKKDVQLGHSYFIDRSDEGGSMDVRLEYEIKPILDEYVKDGILIGDDIKTKIENLRV